MSAQANLTPLSELELAEEVIRPQPWAQDVVLTCVRRLLGVARREEIAIRNDTLVLRYRRPSGVRLDLSEPPLEDVLRTLVIEEYPGDPGEHPGGVLLNMSLYLSLRGLEPCCLATGNPATLRTWLNVVPQIPLTRVFGIPITKVGIPDDCLLMLGAVSRYGTNRDVVMAIKWALPLLPVEKEK